MYTYYIPIPNSQRSRNGWVHFFSFWLGLNSLPRSCGLQDPRSPQSPSFLHSTPCNPSQQNFGLGVGVTLPEQSHRLYLPPLKTCLHSPSPQISGFLFRTRSFYDVTYDIILLYKSYWITYHVHVWSCLHIVGFGLGVGATLPEQSHSLSEVEINQYLKYNWIIDRGQHGTSLDQD